MGHLPKTIGSVFDICELGPRPYSVPHIYAMVKHINMCGWAAVLPAARVPTCFQWRAQALARLRLQWRNLSENPEESTSVSLSCSHTHIHLNAHTPLKIVAAALGIVERQILKQLQGNKEEEYLGGCERVWKLQKNKQNPRVDGNGTSTTQPDGAAAHSGGGSKTIHASQVQKNKFGGGSTVF